jgi:putative copper export protein
MSLGWQIVVFVHLVAMAFFLGGQLLVGIAVPALRRDREVLRAVARRFGWGSLVALAVLAASGAALASHEDRWGSSTLQLKIGLAALLVALALAHLRYPSAHALQGAILVVTLAVVWLGVRLAG